MILKYIEVVIQLLDKIKKGTSSSKLGKTRPVSKNNKSWSQRILVTGHLWKKRSVVSAFVLQKNTKEIECSHTWSIVSQIKHIINNFIMEAA